jgi:hypothetical protein
VLKRRFALRRQGCSTLFYYVGWMSTLFLDCLAPDLITHYRCSQRGQACISICVGVGSILLLEETNHLALGCWFVVTLCVAVSLKSIRSERYLVECVLGVVWLRYFSSISSTASPLNKRNRVLPSLVGAGCAEFF